MRTYFYITKLETDMTTYRKQLHELFTRQYPEISCYQNKEYQIREESIVRNKLISQEVIRTVKRRNKKTIRCMKIQNDITRR